jgi:hypothetical protein
VKGGSGLTGTVWLTLREDGSTQWTGDVTNGESYGYNFALSVFAQTGTIADIGAAHHGHVSGWAEPGDSSDIWREWHDPNPMLLLGVKAYRFSELSLESKVSVDLVDYLEAALDAIFEVAVGAAIGDFGRLILIGVEIGSLLHEDSLVPGTIFAGGVPWLTGPGGIFVRAFMTATNSEGRQLTDAEYAWANDMVFRGSLPPIDSFRITNYLGWDKREFTFPALAGPTLVNLGDATFKNIHHNEPTVIHELVHVCQIAHTVDLAFTTKGIVEQLTNKDDHAYDYGVAPLDFTDLGIEPQAQVVEDWFTGTAKHPIGPPDNRGYPWGAMSAQNPYYQYITNNLRTGHFT